ncbi:MAG: hypothetical protein AAF468_01035 [Pseudomonadota bacterium]
MPDNNKNSTESETKDSLTDPAPTSGTGTGSGTGGDEQVVSANSATIDDRFGQARALHNEAIALRDRGTMLREAQTKYQEVIAMAPDSDSGKLARAVLFEMERKTDRGVISPVFLGIAGLSFYFLVFFAIAWFNDYQWAVDLWSKYRYEAFVVIMVYVAAWGVVYLLERNWHKIPTSTKNVAALFGPLLLIAFGVMAAVFQSPVKQVFIYEIVFILVVCSLPAATYYLFLKTRRPSILNEFVGNLARLGLLAPRLNRRRDTTHTESKFELKSESPEVRESRVESYLQQFEAMYGELRFDGEQGDVLRRGQFARGLINAVSDQKAFSNTSPVIMPLANVRITDIFRANLFIPLCIATILSLVGWLIVLQPQWSLAAQGQTDSIAKVLNVSLSEQITPLTAAFLGAFFFGIQMLMRRFARRDLGPNAYLSFALRIILAVIAAWLVVVLLNYFAESDLTSPEQAGSVVSEASKTVATASESAEAAGTKEKPAGSGSQEGEENDSGLLNYSALLILSFVVGVFPRILWQLITTAVSKIPEIFVTVPRFHRNQPLERLDGLTIWHEVRLEEEDVENVSNMASLDVVDVMLRTQIPAERLVSWIDQSILLSLLGLQQADLENDNSIARKLREIGVRNASQLVSNYEAGGATRDLLVRVLGSSPPEGDAKNESSSSAGGAENEDQGSASDATNADGAVTADKLNPLETLVHSIQLEPNFELVRAWRGV